MWGGEFVLISNSNKRAKSGWLKEHYKSGFYSPLKLQKFLFFYEMLSKVEGEKADFSYLRGYKDGPVFSDVYGDYIYRKPLFMSNVEETYENNKDIVNDDRAKLSGFLVSILNEEELSDLTHEFNVWDAKKDMIDRGIRNVSLYEQDFNQEDVDLLKSLKEAYTLDFIDSVEVLEYNKKNFIINKSDKEKITEEHLEVLLQLSNDENLENPVYINMSEDGVILVD